MGSIHHDVEPLHPMKEWTLGRYIARRLVEIGVNDIFGVPGDFNLLLLDQLLADPDLELRGCCNELNAGYAADGYARCRGVGACAVTFTVGGLSIINAIAGAYSGNLPVICLVGAPNSNDYGTNHILHHTLGEPDFSQEYRCFKEVTCAQVVIQNLDDAQELIDRAISAALFQSKPVYISVCCNLANVSHPSFSHDPIPFTVTQGPNFKRNYGIGNTKSNKDSLEAAVEAAATVLNAAVKPVLVAGSKMRVAKAAPAFQQLADVCGYAVAIMPDAKGQISEEHPQFIGTYWGCVSSSCTSEIVESADCYLFAGPVFNDYSSVGYSLLWSKAKCITVQPDRVTIGETASFGCILMKDFLEALAHRVEKNTASLDNFKRMHVPSGIPLKQKEGEPIKVLTLFKHIQAMLTSENVVISETGDSWFNCQKLRLPQGCGYEFQMQYGSIGWSVGATLGYAQAAGKGKRVISCIGDGSFQVTAQEVSTMIRYGQQSIIFLLNNGGYTIEVEIHDGPYNIIKNWNYTGLVEALHNGEGKVWTCKVRTEEDLVAAISTAEKQKDSLCFIEVILYKHDTSKELLEWGSRVAAANSRPPNPQ
ncbi:hypothetical protein CY35_05G147200 [Sphagnum magellanicum]|nr:hypothetical protein CY35_05G147200 [Sphagnum magellanicum]